MTPFRRVIPNMNRLAARPRDSALIRYQMNFMVLVTGGR